MKLKLKTSGKIIICIFLLILFIIFHLIYKGILFSNYNSNYKKVEELYSDGEILDEVKLTKVRASSYIFLTDDLKISIEYNDLKKKNNKYTITTPDNEEYTLNFEEEKSKLNAKPYIEMFNKYDNVINSKLNYFSSVSKIRKQNNILKRIIKNLPIFDKAGSIDGKVFDGYMYQIDNEYTYVLYGNNKKVVLTFAGDKLNYDYLTYLIATLEVE